MGKVRAAVVLFVDIDEEHVADAHDLSFLVQWGLNQKLRQPGDKFPFISMVIKNQTRDVRVVDVMDAGSALANGYFKLEPSAKSWRDRGIYTEKEQAQIDAEQRWVDEEGV